MSRTDRSPAVADTQLTYLPGRASWFLWSPTGSSPGGALSGPSTGGRAATAWLAVPDGRAVVPREVAGIELGSRPGWDWLRARTSEHHDSASLAAWTRTAGDLSASPRLPTAAHCALTADGGHITTAAGVVDHVRNTLALQDVLAAASWTATLRGYQLAGVEWLAAREGGAILADDMGLGKTVQALAFMTRQLDRPHLVVCPTSVTANWRRETERYARTLRTAADEHPGPGTLTVVSYGTLRRDPGRFAGVSWGVLVCDEAQQVKNPRTLAYRALTRLDARYRLALTGTPVENDLGDLWALADLVNPGALGSRRRFHDRFIVPIQRRGSATAAERLAAHTSALLLRRTKREVAPELPARQLVDVACPISAEQQQLYQRALADVFDTGPGSGPGSGLGSGARRRTSVLALLTRLKQICNHPAQLLRQSGPLPDRSGKFDRLTDMLDETIATGTGCLVFTQYAAMGHLITRHLAEARDLDIPFLHGGLRAAERDRIVHEFQLGRSPDVLVLSLRAAGFGLNLTRATTVIHYDRWWNPAVEDQASDRAHRIGQTQPVTVYTLRAAGTVEDHIATVHTRKRGLANAALTGSDNELLSLADDQLHDILRLDPRRMS